MPNGWRGLMGIVSAARAEHEVDSKREWVECPRDGQALLTNANGVIYCPYDGWRPPGQPAREGGENRA